MRQSHKIEKFKSTQNVEDAIHAKFDSRTLSPVVGDNEEEYTQFFDIKIRNFIFSAVFLILSICISKKSGVIYSLTRLDFFS